jgi:hypothetical protein
MRALILAFSICCAGYGETVTNIPSSFRTTAEMEAWAMSAWGGTTKTELTYDRRKVVIYFRSHTSGISTSEPHIFMQRDGRWMRILTTITCTFDMEATLEGDALVLWRLEGAETLEGQNKRREKTEYLRLNLKALGADEERGHWKLEK